MTKTSGDAEADLIERQRTIQERRENADVDIQFLESQQRRIVALADGRCLIESASVKGLNRT